MKTILSFLFQGLTLLSWVLHCYSMRVDISYRFRNEASFPWSWRNVWISSPMFIHSEWCQNPQESYFNPCWDAKRTPSHNPSKTLSHNCTILATVGCALTVLLLLGGIFCCCFGFSAFAIFAPFVAGMALCGWILLIYLVIYLVWSHQVLNDVTQSWCECDYRTQRTVSP